MKIWRIPQFEEIQKLNEGHPTQTSILQPLENGIIQFFVYCGFLMICHFFFL